jgi:hypothetical protein
MLNVAYGMLAMLPVAFWVGRVRNGVAMTTGWPSPVAESASSTIDPDAQVRRAATGERQRWSNDYVSNRRKNAVNIKNSKSGCR